jgi:hypothetical protein
VTQTKWPPTNPGRFRAATTSEPYTWRSSKRAGAVTLLRFLDYALRVAARRKYVANVYETVRDRSAFFWLHRLLTAGTPNHGMFILPMLHTLSRVTVVAPTGSQKNLAFS